MTAVELLERALADATACDAVAVTIQVTAADGSTWVYQTAATQSTVWVLDAADDARPS